MDMLELIAALQLFNTYCSPRRGLCIWVCKGWKQPLMLMSDSKKAY